MRHWHLYLSVPWAILEKLPHLQKRLHLVCLPAVSLLMTHHRYPSLPVQLHLPLWQDLQGFLMIIGAVSDPSNHTSLQRCHFARKQRHHLWRHGIVSQKGDKVQKYFHRNIFTRVYQHLRPSGSVLAKHSYRRILCSLILAQADDTSPGKLP